MSKLGRLLILKYCHNRTVFNLLKSRSILTRQTLEKIKSLCLSLNHQFFLQKDISKYCLENDQIRLAHLIYYHRWGVNDWNLGLESACQEGHRELVDLMIFNGATNWKWRLYGACREGHRKLVDFMILKGATDWNGGLEGACIGSHQELINLMIVKGATRCDYCYKSSNKHRKENN